MQTQDQQTGAAGSLNHPANAEWMAFLYGELEAPRRRELGAHLERCPECSAQVKAWRASKYDLDEWKLPFRRAAGRAWVPVVRWAAAAAVVLGMGIAVGRLMSPSAGEVAQLKASVAELSAAVHRGGGGGDSPATLAAATTAANAETLRLLTQYSALQASQRSADQLALKDVLDTFDVRLATLRNELETVAVNTEGGFQLTRQNLARLVSVQEPK